MSDDDHEHAPDLREWARERTAWNPDEATDEQDNRPDASMVPYVEALLRNGVRTYQSCAGHTRVFEGCTFHDNGVVWLNSPSFSPERALGTNEFDEISRVWGRESVPVWRVSFPGLASSEAGLRAAMDALWYALGIGENPPHEEEPHVE